MVPSIVHGPSRPPLIAGSIGNLLDEQAHHYPLRHAICAPGTGTRLTYHDLNIKTKNATRALLANGISRGHRSGRIRYTRSSQSKSGGPDGSMGICRERNQTADMQTSPNLVRYQYRRCRLGCLPIHTRIEGAVHSKGVRCQETQSSGEYFRIKAG